MTPDTLITDIQGDLEARLSADEVFSDVPVLSERKADIQREAEIALGIISQKAGHCGACAVVLQPVGNDNLPNVQFGPLDLDLTILILEDPAVNQSDGGTKKFALALARRVRDVLKHYQALGLMQALVPSEKGCIVPVSNPLAPVAYEVRFRTTEADSTVNTKVAAPTISPASGVAPSTITLACITPGAQIYYSLDGTYPTPSQGLLYSAPIALAAAATLRAVANKAGSIASNATQAIFT